MCIYIHNVCVYSVFYYEKLYKLTLVIYTLDKSALKWSQGVGKHLLAGIVE